MDKHNYSMALRLALQAALRLMNHTRFFQEGLLDSLVARQNAQICFSEASEGISFDLLHLYAIEIHNYQLSILVAGKKMK